ncbi:MAG: hypothetical protein ABR497_10390 [Kiritimatiellia bacterium]
MFTTTLAASDTKVLEPIEIGSRLELFTDDFLIERLSGAAALRMHATYEAPVVNGPSGAYMTILHDEDRYLGYYRAVSPDFDGKRRDGHAGERTCVVVSEDGITWITPDLGTKDELGYPNVLEDIRPPLTHNFSPFLDTRPGIPEDERFKAVAGIKQRALRFRFRRRIAVAVDA